MKNSPDTEWLDTLQGRLRAYTEEPDADLWNKIVHRAGDRTDPVWIPWMQRTLSALSLLVLLWSLSHQVSPGTGVRTLSASERYTRRNGGSTIQRQPGENHQVMQSDDDAAEQKSRDAVTRGEDANQILPARTSETTTMPPLSNNTTSMIAIPTTVISDNITTDETAVDQSPDIELRKPARKRGLRFYASISPSLAFQKLTPFADDGVRIESFYSRPVLSVNRLGVALQAGVQERIGRRLEVYSGLSLYKQSQQIVYHYYSDDIVTNQNDDFEYSVSPGTQRKSVGYDMTNVGVDAGVIYFLTGDRLLHKIGAGLSWNHGMKKRTDKESYDNSRSHYLQYHLFYRNELVVNYRLNIFIEPFYKHVLLSSETLDEPFRVRPYRAGLTFGVVYNLR